jgi:serpin B
MKPSNLILLIIILCALALVGSAVYVSYHPHVDNYPVNPQPTASVSPTANPTMAPTASPSITASSSAALPVTKPRLATNAEINQAVAANNAFAFDLYGRYATNSGNLFFSPYSITTALAMTGEGAKGQTASEINKVFHITQSADSQRTAEASIYNDLNTANQPFMLSTANALWAEKTYQFLGNYLTLVANYYGGKVTNLDFKTASEKSRQTINSWVAAQTHNKITNLIPMGAIDAFTRLVLTNAIYFKGTWVVQFDKTKTKKADFHVDDATTVQADMMTLAGEKALFNYAETPDAQVLQMPYSGNKLSMLVILPKQGAAATVNARLQAGAATAAAYISNIREGLIEKQRVNVYMPKFTFKTTYSLGDDLKALGMPTAFSGSQADFSGMDGTTDLYIAAVIHQAFVAVDEEGTEAAAATAVIVGTSAVMSPRPIPEFRADHPFIFLIQNDSTGEILFMGRVTNPTLQ